MVNHPSRRDFLKTCSTAAAATTLLNTLPAFSANRADPSAPKRWFKGNLHMHNQWSDGKPLAPWAIDWYKTHGYAFICPTDHNIFQSDELRFHGFGFNNQPSDLAAFNDETSLWKVISPVDGWPKMTQRYIDESMEKFGKDAVRTITVGGQTYVRMTTFAELEKQFVEPGKFLMIPGYEQTGGCHNGQQVHMNFINVREVFPYIQAETPEEIFEQSFTKGKEVYRGQDYLFIADHPLWRYYDFSPKDLIALPRIRLFELNNNSIDDRYDAHPEGWKPEEFWDVVNAHRAAHDQPLLLGMGSDDRHDYSKAAKAWCVVRAESLAVTDLLAAIREGDFYASNGLDFEDIQFDGDTLSVKIDVREDARYRIEFIGTKKDYDASSQQIEVQKGPRNPARKIDVFSDSIGVVLDVVEGTEGSYTLKPEDLYVRAKIVKVGNDAPSDWQSHPAAWTQPYR